LFVLEIHHQVAHKKKEKEYEENKENDGLE